MIAALAVALVLHADFAAGTVLSKTNVYTGCGGKNVSPALRWSNAPASTRSYVLTVFDPDAPNGGFWHWIAYDVPSTAQALLANAGARATPPMKFATNGFGHERYDGPCPPPGPAHHYVFTLYALDVPHAPLANGDAVASTLEGHIVAQATLAARYGR